MKYFNTTLMISLLFLLASCTKESELAKELSEADKISLEGMEEAEHEAKEYNDSLMWCTDTNNLCTSITIAYYDSLFHYNVNQYDFHHTKYSHNNLEDDHHHEIANSHSHGNAMHTESEEEEEHGHSIESHQEMMMIKTEHEPYHP